MADQIKVNDASIITAMLAANAVTDAKMATSTANSLAGYDGSGAFAGVAVGTGLSLSGGTLTGHVGTVTAVSVASANGLGGTVANPTTTPAITLTTSVTGILKGDGTGVSAATAGTDYGSVTSVGMTVPSWLSVAGSPVTASGTLTVTAATGQTANRVLATPDGSTGAVSLRALVAADIPSIAESQVTGLVSDLSTLAAAIAGAGTGSVTSVALTIPSWLAVAGSPVTTSGTLAVTAATGQAANRFVATPDGTTGAVGLRAIAAGDLPVPSSSTLGGIQSAAAVSHQWIDSVSTSGVPHLSQPAFSDISGTASAGQLPTTGLTITQHAGSIVAATDGATITFDLSLGDWQKVTLGGNRTLALSNPTTGQQFTLILVQDGTGSRVPSWFSGIKWPGGTAPTLTTTAGGIDVFTFKCVSAGVYYGFAAGLALA